MLKLFDNCKTMRLEKGDKLICGMTSEEREGFNFQTPQKPDGAVEIWVGKVDDEM